MTHAMIRVVIRVVAAVMLVFACIAAIRHEWDFASFCVLVSIVGQNLADDIEPH